MKFILLFFTALLSFNAIGQSYTSYFTGNETDAITQPIGGICLMGGASEHDNAMRWFLERANGGDILVLRASGSNGYNNYMYSQLGVSVNSVETIVCNNASASNDPYLHQKIQKAEAIWFAGGDQWDYVSYWRDTPVDSLINLAIQNRNIVVGGTSAGMAILGKFYYSAQNGSVTSSVALSNPYINRVTVDSTTFLKSNFLTDVITDTHYDDPNRKGRHVVFLARILADYGIEAKGIACNEYTAVCIDENGLTRVFGDYPAYPEMAFFLQTNCELTNRAPETCMASSPLNWNLDGKAIRVYKVFGTNQGINTFDLSDWESGEGGVWENWYVDNGTLVETSGIQINCSGLSVPVNTFNHSIQVFPNPATDKIEIQSVLPISQVLLVDMHGKQVFSQKYQHETSFSIPIKKLSSGIYFLQFETEKEIFYHKLYKK